MPFALEIIFTGLLAFVPVDTTGDTRPDMAWVLFLDALVPEPPMDRDGKVFDSHHPAIRIFEESLDPSGRQPRSWIGTGSGKFGVVVFDQEDLTLSLSGGPTAFEVVSGKRVKDLQGRLRPLPCCSTLTGSPCLSGTPSKKKCVNEMVPATEQMRDFDWVPSFEEIMPGAKIDPDLLGMDLSKLGRLAARFKIEKGVLETALLDRASELTPARERYLAVDLVKFDPTPSGSLWRPRAVARQLVLRIGGLTGEVYLKSKRLGGASPEFKDLILKPVAGCPSPCVVRVRLFNSMLPELYDRHAHSGSNRHFELLWSLVSAPPKKRPAPERELLPPDDDLICPVVRP